MPVAAVVDTNVWGSAFLNPRGYPAQIYQAAIARHFQSVTSPILLAELEDVLSRPRVVKSRHLTPAQVSDYLDNVFKASEMIEVTASLKLCRDLDDNILLETALNGHALIIVSRDEDLTRDLDLKTNAEKYGIQLVTVNHFLQTFAGG